MARGSSLRDADLERQFFASATWRKLRSIGLAQARRT
jgi:hypothetical protein